MRQRKKERVRNEWQQKRVYQPHGTVAGLTWMHFVMVPAVLGLVLVFGFPEIGHFIGDFARRLYSHKVPGVHEMKANVSTEQEAAETPELPEEIQNFEPTYQKTFTTKKIFLEGRRIAPVELSPQNNVSAGELRFDFVLHLRKDLSGIIIFA